MKCSTPSTLAYWTLCEAHLPTKDIQPDKTTLSFIITTAKVLYAPLFYRLSGHLDKLYSSSSSMCIEFSGEILTFVEGREQTCNVAKPKRVVANKLPIRTDPEEVFSNCVHWSENMIYRWYREKEYLQQPWRGRIGIQLPLIYTSVAWSKFVSHEVLAAIKRKIAKREQNLIQMLFSWCREKDALQCLDRSEVPGQMFNHR